MAEDQLQGSHHRAPVVEAGYTCRLCVKYWVVKMNHGGVKLILLPGPLSLLPQVLKLMKALSATAHACAIVSQHSMLGNI